MTADKALTAGKKGINGYKFEVGNTPDLENSIEKIVNCGYIKRMGEESIKIVNKYSFSQVVDSWMDAFIYALNN